MLVSRRAALNTLIAGGVGTVVGGAAYGLAYSRHQIQVVRATVPVSGLNPALDGLRIGLITDLHHSEMVPAQRCRARGVVDDGGAPRPDRARRRLCDLGRSVRTSAPCSEALAGLTAPFGVYARGRQSR